MWHYKVLIWNKETNQGCFLYYKSGDLSFNLTKLINKSHRNEDGTFIKHDDGSFDWVNMGRRFSYDSAIDLLNDIKNVSIERA